MKKCCLNCVFCMRCQENIYYTHSSGVKEHISSDSLSDKQREQALLNNFSFLGEEKRIQQEWERVYNQKFNDLKRGKYNSQIGGSRVLELLMKDSSRMISIGDEQYPLAEDFGMPPHPDAPDADYLSCWHNLWNFRGKEQEFSSLSQKNKCLFFYPYNKKGHKSFEGCEKERKELLAKSRFSITNWLVILGMFVTILIFAIQKFDAEKSLSSQQSEKSQTTEGQKR